MKRYILLIFALLATLTDWAQVPVIITAGQSNTDGRVTEELPSYIKENGYKHCKWCFGSSGKIRTDGFEPYWPKTAHAQHPNSWAYDAVFYYLLEQELKRDFYVIKWSVGGTAIDPSNERSTHGKYWSANPEWLAKNKSTLRGGKSLLLSFIEEIDQCIDSQLSQLPEGFEIKAFLWHQGESDYTAGALYYDNLKAVVEYVRRHLVEKTGNANYATLPFICGTVSRSNRCYNADVENAMWQLSKDLPNFHVIDMSKGELQSDRLHFTAKSAEYLGNEMFKVYKLLQKERPRILISTDIGGTDPDDNQSMLHMLMYSDLFDIEGIVSSPSFGDGSKEEILRMIDIYEKDFPVLRKHCPQLKMPEELRTLCKQGRHGLAPFAGYNKPTEGSEWIVECARRHDSRPLYVLVWGTLEDVAQALHDAPDIVKKIRVYYIGGPNKKFGVNSYAYIVEHFPNLWMIENNASYRGLISVTKDKSRYHAGYYDACMKGAGNIGADFINYYKGVVKMGDTPSLLYMMHGNPDDPWGESWGGSFEKISRSPRRIIDPTTEPSGTVAVYSVVEFRFKGKKLKLAPGTPCFNLFIDKQNWQGYYVGKGEYCVRYSPKQTATLDYEITCDNGAFQPIKGTLDVDNQRPGTPSKTDYRLGQTWWTDRADASLFEGKWQGAATVSKFREQVLDDWAVRLGWLKENSLNESNYGQKTCTSIKN